MIDSKNPRELEQSYLAVSRQLGDVLSRKMAVYEMHNGVAHLHQRIVEVGQAMLSAADPRPHENEYLHVAAELQTLLQKKAAMYALDGELTNLHGELIALGRELGWTHGGPAESFQLLAPAPVAEHESNEGPVPEERFSRLQQQIEDLRTALA